MILYNELGKQGKLDSIGGAAYLTSLTEDVPSAANILYYANISSMGISSS